MNNEVKQTAVEWFMEQIGEKQPNGLYVISTLEDVQNVFQQAKEREEVQIINAYTQGQYDGDNIREGDAYEYYNLIYGDTK